jgi:hypothetical protein
VSATVHDPCGECLICQLRMIAALVNDDMRVFLSTAIESMIQSAAADILAGGVPAMAATQVMPHLLDCLLILTPGRIGLVVAALNDLGINTMLMREES